MSGGLIALLDDVAAIAKLAAASLDDVGLAATKVGVKAVGVVVDDTAVTPSYVTGFTPDRELPIIWRIAGGSLRNKILIILPALLALNYWLPQAISPILMLGGAYLCYEGAEKLYEAITGGHAGESGPDETLTGRAREDFMVSGAIRTDFILSAEIMVISLGEVADMGLLQLAMVLLAVAFAITFLVYGVVALIVKMDDLGLRLARRPGPSQAVGRALVRGMPHVMSVLSVVGTAAMLWVGGHIVLAGLEKFGYGAPIHVLHDLEHAAAHALPAVGGLVTWLVETLGSALVGLVVGAVLVGVMHLIPRRAH
ncbi:DUF808 domain-containing protein [Deinococcus lacus]|uniref:DUF808 domain-containing protein n=1 Tax=Deinococcus lacus TaxID=392561 RepID=A0ABW1YIA2_9DEIO